MIPQPVATCASHDSVRQIEELVQRRLSGRVRSLKLQVHDEGLVLHGHARRYYAKQLAQHALMELTKVRIRANEIEVAQAPKSGTSK